mmetsp:Transcript_49311/g.88069  ORF Transcript_49311/g.88069 Transcript_49311/m.88069 type:complete len:121 (+) Transcript_49311:601-963(+)
MNSDSVPSHIFGINILLTGDIQIKHFMMHNLHCRLGPHEVLNIEKHDTQAPAALPNSSSLWRHVSVRRATDGLIFNLKFPTRVGVQHAACTFCACPPDLCAIEPSALYFKRKNCPWGCQS